jgi:DNA-binding GntR family transcriptional regulator
MVRVQAVLCRRRTSYTIRITVSRYARIELPLTRAEAIYSDLRERIVNGTLSPGQKLVIDEIARVTGLSQSPVREALRRLEAEGLVRNVPHVGVMVTEATPRELVDDYRIVAVLSGLATRLAAPLLSELDLAQMQALVNQMDACIAEGRLQDGNALNLELHDVIYRTCGSERLRSMIVDLWQLSIHRHRLVFGLVPGRAQQANDEHRALLTALRTRDPDAADRMMREHLWHAAEAFERHFGLSSEGGDSRAPGRRVQRRGCDT